jgi:hypothetical protein
LAKEEVPTVVNATASTVVDATEPSATSDDIEVAPEAASATETYEASAIDEIVSVEAAELTADPSLNVCSKNLPLPELQRAPFNSPPPLHHSNHSNRPKLPNDSSSSGCVKRKASEPPHSASQKSAPTRLRTDFQTAGGNAITVSAGGNASVFNFFSASAQSVEIPTHRIRLEEVLEAALAKGKHDGSSGFVLEEEEPVGDL